MVPLPTSLQKAFNTTLNDLGAEMALIALKEDGFGPFVSHAYRGFTPREIQAVVRALSHPEVGLDGAVGNGNARQRLVRIRMTAPSARSRLPPPLEISRRICGAPVIGRKDIVTFSDKDRKNLTEAAEELEAALVKAGVPAPAAGAPAAAAAPTAPSGAGSIDPLMAQIRSLIPYDHPLLTRNEPGSKTLTTLLSHTPGHCEWREGQTLTLEGSAAGWVIRHRRPRVDRDLASTQGRFLDYKELYKDKFKTAMVLPLKKGQDLIGTILLGSRTPDVSYADMARAGAPRLHHLAALLPTLGPGSAASPSLERTDAASSVEPGRQAASMLAHDPHESHELMLRHERQQAIREVTAFLEQEIQRPLTKTRLEVEEAVRNTATGGAASAGGTRWPSRFRTTARRFPRSTSVRSSSPASPPRPPAPGSGWRPSKRSSKSTGARSPSPAARTRAPRSSSACRRMPPPAPGAAVRVAITSPSPLTGPIEPGYGR